MSLELKAGMRFFGSFRREAQPEKSLEERRSEVESYDWCSVLPMGPGIPTERTDQLFFGENEFTFKS